MFEDHTTSQPEIASDVDEDNGKSEIKIDPAQRWSQFWENLVRFGLGEVSLRVGSGLASIALILLVVWVMGNFYLNGQALKTNTNGSVQAAPAPTPTDMPDEPQIQVAVVNPEFMGVTRQVQLHTILPERPRMEIQEYTVQKGDTVFEIAKRFGLKPETIFWGNYDVLADDPHRLTPGKKLKILPVNGVLYEWHEGDGLNGVAKFYGVTPDDIITFPGNKLSPDSVGDLAAPNIPAGTKLVIPGGKREYISWSAPRITRTNASSGKVLGAGVCGSVTGGPVGVGLFIWPTTVRTISGYDFSPETNHWGIDIGGVTGNPIYASDNGVIVYAGWNDWGYGNLVVIDHGNGWQTLYGHLSQIYVSCGAFVYQGNAIGALGSTGNSSGPHLHFELRSDQWNRVDPKNFLK